MKSNFFKSNRNKLSQKLGEGIVILSPGFKKRVSTQEYYDFIPNPMFYYLTGLSDPELILVINIKDSIAQSYLYLPKPDPNKEKWEGKQLTREIARNKSGIENINYLGAFQNDWHWLGQETNRQDIFMNLADGQLQPFIEMYGLPLNRVEVKCVHSILSELRVVKTEEEIQAISHASKIASIGFEHVMNNAKVGMYEYELEAFHDYKMKSAGLKPGNYKTIMASGKNATILHYLDNNVKTRHDDLVLMDVDVKVDFYHTDLTRVFPITGRFTERQRAVYTSVLDVQRRVIDYLKPGLTYGEINNYARSLLNQVCIELNLLSDGLKLEDYYFHNIGHHIGLDTHDVSPFTDETVLREGMVLTIEPGIYIEKESIGIRIEDIVAIRSTGAEVLSSQLIKDPDEIEMLMKEVR